MVLDGIGAAKRRLTAPDGAWYTAAPICVPARSWWAQTRSQSSSILGGHGHGIPSGRRALGGAASEEA